jgi:hypothetical protein
METKMIDSIPALVSLLREQYRGRIRMLRSQFASGAYSIQTHELGAAIIRELTLRL